MARAVRCSTAAGAACAPGLHGLHGLRAQCRRIARRQYVEDDGEQAKIIDSADTDARWVKKGKQAFFGYRGHTAVDSEDGYVEHVQVHPANEAEITKLPEIIEALSRGIKAVLADKGYASEANRQWLNERGSLELAKAEPIVYSHGGYYGLSELLGTFGWSVKKKKRC